MVFFVSRLSKQILTVDSRSKAFGVVDFALLGEKKKLQRCTVYADKWPFASVTSQVNHREK